MSESKASLGILDEARLKFSILLLSECMKSAELKSITADVSKMTFKQAQKTDKIFTNMQFGECMFSMTTEDYKSDDPNENNMMFAMPSREDLI